MTHTAKLFKNRAEYMVIVSLDGKVIERDWSFKKVQAKKILAKLVEKYSIAPESITLA